MAALTSRTKSNTAPSAPAVLRSLSSAAVNPVFAVAIASFTRACSPSPVTVSSRVRQFMIRPIDSSAWSIPAHVKFSCFR